MNNESKFSAFAHKFKYRSPLWIESDSDVSKSSSDSRDNNGGLCNSDDSIGCHSSDSSGSINNFLDSKIPEHHQSSASGFSDGDNTADDHTEVLSDDDRANVRVICDNNITIEQLSKSGVITMGDSCVIKDRMFTIYAHKSLSNTIKTKIDVMNIEIPPINNLINLSIPFIAPLNETDDIIKQQEDIKAIEKTLKEMKSNQELEDQVTFHDIHHYVAIYTLVGVVVVCIILYAWQRMRACQPRPALAPPAAEQVETTTEQAEASVSYVAPIATAAGRPTITTTSRGSSPAVRTQFNEIS
ncbi:unnamed protein product [Spodoptera exigua]|nr:unnamed protein product [Spodoptera exigua]